LSTRSRIDWSELRVARSGFVESRRCWLKELLRLEWVSLVDLRVRLSRLSTVLVVLKELLRLE
jgi:hypothetical protein